MPAPQAVHSNRLISAVLTQPEPGRRPVGHGNGTVEAAGRAAFAVELGFSEAVRQRANNDKSSSGRFRTYNRAASRPHLRRPVDPDSRLPPLPAPALAILDVYRWPTGLLQSRTQHGGLAAKLEGDALTANLHHDSLALHHHRRCCRRGSRKSYDLLVHARVPQLWSQRQSHERSLGAERQAESGREREKREANGLDFPHVSGSILYRFSQRAKSQRM